MEDSFEDTQAMKGAKAYILKERFASFKMKEDESVPVTEPTNYTKLSKKIIRQSRRFSKLKPV